MNGEIDSARAIEVNSQSSTCCGAFVGGTTIKIELWSIDCLKGPPDNPFRAKQGLAAGVAPQGQPDRGDQQLENLRSGSWCSPLSSLYSSCCSQFLYLESGLAGYLGPCEQQWRPFFRVCKCAAWLSFAMNCSCTPLHTVP
jgi:hypothetical protein